MNRTDRITAILTQAFRPIHLEVRDTSGQHIGHVGARPGGETHYEVVIAAEDFTPMSKVARHQAIYRLLTQEMQTGLHALSIQVSAPGEK